MHRFGLVAVALAAASLMSLPALAEEPAGAQPGFEGAAEACAYSAEPVAEEVANGFQLKVELARKSLGDFVFTESHPVVPLSVSPTVAPGLHLDRLSLFLGLSFVRIAEGENGIAFLGLHPTARWLLTEPRVGNVSPFVSAEFAYLIPIGEKVSKSDAEFAFALGGGAIYHVSRHFAVSAEANLRSVSDKFGTVFLVKSGFGVLSLEGVASVEFFL